MKKNNHLPINSIGPDVDDYDQPPFIRVFPKILLCIGIFVVVFGCFRVYSNRINPSWIVTTGMITASTMESYDVMADNAENTTFYYSKITYEYSVNNSPHSNSEMIGNVSANDSSPVNQIIKHYPEGQLVKVYYNPEKPEESIIENKDHNIPRFFFIIGALFILPGIIPVNIYHKVLGGFSSKTHDAPVVSRTLKSSSLKNANVDKITPRITEVAPPFTGKWKLDYQIPSMGEILSSSSNSEDSTTLNANALMMSGPSSTTVSITGATISFQYEEAANGGGCEIVSSYRLSDDKLMLEHEHMDFVMTDIEDFPPTVYTYSLKGKKLVLTSNEIKGIGNRKIVYHLSKN